MTLSSSILNSDDPEWIQGRLLAELQRLNARIDELEDKASSKGENLLDLDSKPQARRNIGIPDGSSSAPYLTWGANGWTAGDIATAETLGDLTDVTLTSPASGQVLTYNGSIWLNDHVPPTDWADITNKPATFPPSAHTHTLSGDVTGTVTGAVTIANGAVTEAKIASNAVTTAKINDGAVTAAKVDPDDFILKHSNAWTIDGTESVLLKGGSDITFANGSPGFLTPVTQNSGIGWVYSFTRYVAWTYYNNRLVLGDGSLGQSPSGKIPIQYTPSPNDASRKIDLDVKLELQGSAGTLGQVIRADSNGVPEWASGALPVTLTRVDLTSGASWSVPTSARSLIVTCIGAGGGGSRIDSTISGYIAVTSGGSPDIPVYSLVGSAGNGGDASVRFYSVSGGETATISIGSGGSGTSSVGVSGGAGGDTSFTLNSVTVTAAGGRGGDSAGTGSANHDGDTNGQFTMSGEQGMRLHGVISRSSMQVAGGSSGAGGFGGKGGNADSVLGRDGENGRIVIFHDG